MDQFIPNLRDETVQTAVKNLLTYSLTIIVVPLGSMFILKKFFFEGQFHSKRIFTSPICFLFSTNISISVPLVYLGFGKVLEPHLSYRLLPHYLPLGKIGGKPAWLNPVNLPAFDSLLCRVCGKSMAFLCQVYATNPNDHDYSFHRTLFFFICRNSLCSRNQDSSNARAFRCTLPRYNDFYPSDSPPDPDFDEECPDPFRNQNYSKLCEICGCSAMKKCARCESAWYCGREHQIIDWNSSHKSKCKKVDINEPKKPENIENGDNENWLRKPKRSVAANPFVFPEYAIEMGTEHFSRSKHILSDDEDDDDSDDDRAKKRMDDYKEYLKNFKGSCDMNKGDLEMAESPSEKDIAFKRFNKIVALNPEQVLRYSRGGEPLLATDHALPPHAIPPCSLCGSERQFELQLMPHLLSLIGVDCIGKSIDWATMMLYTCKNNCHIANDGYAEEYIYKQDFN
ncbi:unnamed protein product [Thelazia callipaeda]|uniref:MYND-type domain-containing protein n=1 Tax=Thelazia callipaeda TaxID=103827 RepID=A0A0N5D319_THECL|nr:unnamed protein product [Thelazia callipaeda]